MQDKRTEELLKQQVLDMMNEEKNPKIDKGKSNKSNKNKKGKKKKHRILKAIAFTLMTILLLLILLVGTKPGRSLLYKVASKFVYSNVQRDITDEADEEPAGKRKPSENVISEDYVYNYLIFGIEKIGGEIGRASCRERV